MTPPSKKIANEDYFWILKQNKDFKSKEKEIRYWEDRALAQVLGVSSPNKEKSEIISSHHLENESLDLDQIELPRETLYMIDKVVRQRVTKGPFGADFSELLNEEDIRLSRIKNDNI